MKQPRYQIGTRAAMVGASQGFDFSPRRSARIATDNVREILRFSSGGGIIRPVTGNAGFALRYRNAVDGLSSAVDNQNRQLSRLVSMFLASRQSGRPNDGSENRGWRIDSASNLPLLDRDRSVPVEPLGM